MVKRFNKKPVIQNLKIILVTKPIVNAFSNGIFEIVLKLNNRTVFCFSTILRDKNKKLSINNFKCRLSVKVYLKSHKQ